MEPEGSVPCFEEPSIGPCPKPIYLRSILILSFPVLPRSLFPSGFPDKNLVYKF
jgi:hypothetical protein